MTRVITLTTDFGTQDWFVGSMKGVILGIAPGCAIVDLTHGIPAGDVNAGAFALAAACAYFPQGTIHLAVVDPGVGSGRAALGVETARFTFVGPDNGLLSRALRFEKVKTVRRLENRRYFGAAVSPTFHGRDLFAPVAAHLSRGVPLSRMGREAADFCRLPLPEPKVTSKGIRGEIQYVDRFGNAITNIGSTHLREVRFDHVQIVARGRRRTLPMVEFYQAVQIGGGLAYMGSNGWLEIAIHGGSAAEGFGVKVGDVVNCLVTRPRLR